MRLNDAKNSLRYNLAIKLRKEGNTYREIGQALGVTKGRAWQIVNIDKYREILKRTRGCKYGNKKTNM